MEPKSLDTLLRPRACTGEPALTLLLLVLEEEEEERPLIDCNAWAAALVTLRVCGCDDEAAAAPLPFA